MINVENVSKKIQNKNILENINFRLLDGDVLGIVGPNGTGKSTLISVMSSVIKPTTGNISFYENDKVITNNIKSKIGYIPQEIALYEELTIKDNLLLFAPSKFTKHEALNRAKDISNKLSLVRDFDTRVSKLSGGTKRRVNIGVALMTSPKYIFMDEPVVGVDYTVRRDIEQFIRNLKDSGKIIIIASHLVEFLENTCNKLLVIKEGKQEYFGDFENEF
ncbi:ABC transporter ATP-binding protein [Clostridiaceae bacterium M8S5]|nr:ABC transporter ATP-binding protein [Clostridiaceae bacterium M8S5]